MQLIINGMHTYWFMS